MVRRTLTALLLLAVLVPVVYLGGVPYFVLVAAFVGIAAREYCQMFELKGYEPLQPLTVGAALLILAARAFAPAAAPVILTIAVLAAMVVHLFRLSAVVTRPPRISRWPWEASYTWAGSVRTCWTYACFLMVFGGWP
jgi:CDP-diglyceride synthetase